MLTVTFQREIENNLTGQRTPLQNSVRFSTPDFQHIEHHLHIYLQRVHHHVLKYYELYSFFVWLLFNVEDDVYPVRIQHKVKAARSQSETPVEEIFHHFQENAS